MLGIMHDSGTIESGAEELAVLVSPLAGQANYRPLVAWFVKGLPLRVDAMRQATRTGAWEDLARLAHQLKGAGASYGYPAISEAAAGLERAAREQSHQQARECCEQLSGQCEAARRGLA
ncbi:MAG: Hpt domain-containing protein [Phycisphaeraceae bacterium]